MRTLNPWLLAVVATLALGMQTGVACAERVDAPRRVRVKELGRLQGWRDNALVGYGIVSGLAGTGDSPTNRTTRQALSNMLSQFNLTIGPEQMQTRNVAVVLVTAMLPPHAREGDGLDVTVSSAGDARSLVGGSLLMTPLKAANGRIYALAQGPLSVGGYRYDANGNVVQKNHPTVGAIPNGAIVEVGVAPESPIRDRALTFILSEPDYTTATRVAAAIGRELGPGIAHARDASGISISVPVDRAGDVVGFMAAVESVQVDPDRRGRVVINEKTGTVVAGADVRIARVSISHGDLKIVVAARHEVSQPVLAGRGAPGVHTAAVTNARLDVEEVTGASGLTSTGPTVADLVQSLARLKIPTRDVISILRAIKSAGALHAELVIQ